MNSTHAGALATLVSALPDKFAFLANLLRLANRSDKVARLKSVAPLKSPHAERRISMVHGDGTSADGVGSSEIWRNSCGRGIGEFFGSERSTISLMSPSVERFSRSEADCHVGPQTLNHLLRVLLVARNERSRGTTLTAAIAVSPRPRFAYPSVRG